MPAIIPVSFIGIITRYVYFKIAFVKYSRVPKAYNEALNLRTMNIMKIAIIAKCIYATWIFGVDDIFAREYSVFSFTVLLPINIDRFHHCVASSTADIENISDLVLFDPHNCIHSNFHPEGYHCGVFDQCVQEGEK